jgi:hypothetical protein
MTSRSAYRVLQHFAHRAGSKLAELLPDELALGFVIGPVEKQHVKMRIEP